MAYFILFWGGGGGGGGGSKRLKAWPCAPTWKTAFTYEWKRSSAITHAEHCFPGPSSKLCQSWLRHWRGTLHLHAAVHRCCQHPLKGLGTNYTNKTVEATRHPSTHINMKCIHLGYKKNNSNTFCLDLNNFGFICAGISISNKVSYKRNVWYNLSCLLQAYCHLNIIEKLLADADIVVWVYFETCGGINYHSGWMDDIVNQCFVRSLCGQWLFFNAEPVLYNPDMRLAITPGPTVHWLFRSHDLPSKFSAIAACVMDLIQ